MASGDPNDPAGRTGRGAARRALVTIACALLAGAVVYGVAASRRARIEAPVRATEQRVRRDMPGALEFQITDAEVDGASARVRGLVRPERARRPTFGVEDESSWTRFDAQLERHEGDWKLTQLRYTGSTDQSR